MDEHRLRLVATLERDRVDDIALQLLERFGEERSVSGCQVREIELLGERCVEYLHESADVVWVL